MFGRSVYSSRQRIAFRWTLILTLFVILLFISALGFGIYSAIQKDSHTASVDNTSTFSNTVSQSASATTSTSVKSSTEDSKSSSSELSSSSSEETTFELTTASR